jgi:alpha-glucosidase/alpha-D-xyloside xylohydrolase
MVLCGELAASILPYPLTIRIERGNGDVVQELIIDESSGELGFSLAGGLLLSLGQGGPQIDRRGHNVSMISGQGGYKLGTHGAGVPIQFPIGTAGWGMFVHAPLGTLT